MSLINVSRSFCRQFSKLLNKQIKYTSSVYYMQPMQKVSINYAAGFRNIQPIDWTKPINQRLYSTSASNKQSIIKNDDNKTTSHCIYYGPLTTRMKMVKVFSLTTSLAGLAAQPILMEQGMKLGGTPLAVFFCTFAGFFTFVTPLLLHFITKKYVTEIKYDADNDEYTATTISIILNKKQTKFRPSDVKVPEIPGMFTSFEVGNKALFVDASFFTDPEHYARIMGYDKPIDFKLDVKETPIKK